MKDRRHVKPEPRMDLSAVVATFMAMAGLPSAANFLFSTVMATKMLFVGRGAAVASIDLRD